LNVDQSLEVERIVLLRVWQQSFGQPAQITRLQIDKGSKQMTTMIAKQQQATKILLYTSCAATPCEINSKRGD
jgi:hypothetical protein